MFFGKYSEDLCYNAEITEKRPAVTENAGGNTGNAGSREVEK